MCRSKIHVNGQPELMGRGQGSQTVSCRARWNRWPQAACGAGFVVKESPRMPQSLPKRRKSDGNKMPENTGARGCAICFRASRFK